MEKREGFPVLNGRKALFLAVLVFAWLNFSMADENKLNIFQDRDQDGLSDSEESAYGTDPDNQDTDGDGYSDGAEVASGYDPLKPAPGDKIVASASGSDPQVAGQSDEKENLTELFIEKIQQEKGDELEILRQFSSNPEEFESEEELEMLSEVSLTEQDIEALLQESLMGNLEPDQLEILNESEISVLPKPTGKNEQEIKEKEREQLEQYFTAVGYVVLSHSPVDLESQQDLNTKGMDFINQMVLYVQQGEVEKVEEIQNKAAEAFEEIKAIQVPEVFKEIHLTGLSVLNYMLKLEAAQLTDSSDPINQVLALGKIQAALSELQAIQDQTLAILESYEIKAFLPEDYSEEKSNDQQNQSDEAESETQADDLP